mgnify:CR=1 FL=1
MVKVCKKHGETEHVKESGGYLRCKKCRVEAVSNRRKNVKRKLIEYAGGKCIHCGYDRCDGVLQFHHRDPKEKSFAIAKSGLTRSFDKLKAEVDKCDLVCANCHAEVHAGLI